MSATVKIIPTKSTSALIEYVGRVEVSEVDNVDRQRVMFASGQHCRPETAIQEFRALREAHGRQGEMRTLPGKYVQDEDVPPTHIKVGKNWRRVRAGEVATHSRQEPEVPFEKRAEGYHYIISFAPDTVNRDDPEQCRKAFEAVEAMWAQDYPGTQATLTAHGDATGSKDAIERGEDGKFHVHVAANAVIHSEMEIDGRVYQPGQRMAGAATNIDTIRERWDTFLQTRGHEFGLEPQDRAVLPAVHSEEYRSKPRRTNQDFWEKERGGISDHDRARRGLEAAFEKLAQDPAAMSQLSATERMQRLASEAAATGDLELKLQKNGRRVRSFVVPDRKQPIRSTMLGGRYDNDGLPQQLELIAQGQWKPLERAQSGPVKPIAELDDAQLDQLQQSVDALAAKEIREQQLDAWIKDWADDEGMSVEGLLESKDMSGSAEDRIRLQRWKTEWDTKKQVAAQQQAAKPEPVAEKTTVDLEIEELKADMERRAAQGLALSPQDQEAQEPVQLDAKPAASQSAEPPSATPHQKPIAVATEKPAATGGTKSTAVAEPTEDKPQLRDKRDIGRLNPRQMQDRELIATVQQERADGGAYVTFELAAHDPVAAGRQGLFLHARAQERTSKNGDVRRQVNTWQQLTKSEYAKLQLVADESSTEVKGRKVFGVRGDIVPWRLSGSGYEGFEAAVDALAPSRRPGIGPDVLAKQQHSENEARKAKLADRIEQIVGADGPDDASDETKPAKPMTPAMEKIKALRARQATQNKRIREREQSQSQSYGMGL